MVVVRLENLSANKGYRMLKLESIYDVVVAKDGQEAYDKVKASMEQDKVFDLIFMDIQMPNLDGLQSTRLIRQMGYSAPIVALTAFAEQSNVKDCYDSGMVRICIVLCVIVLGLIVYRMSSSANRLGGQH